MLLWVMGLLLAVTGQAARLAATSETLVNSVGMKLVHIPAGSFLMGSASGGDFDERPVHRVAISKPFFMSATEVTNAQYKRFVDATGHDPPSQGRPP